MTDALSPSILKSAFQSVVSQDSFADKIRWWLDSPHSAERWLQFELAYQLNRNYAEKFVAACEIEWADIAVFNPPSSFPLWLSPNEPIAKLELKVIGNWWIAKDQIDGIQGDITKVTEKYQQPSAALVFTTVFSAPAADVRFATLLKQMKACETASFEDIRRRLAKLNLLNLDSFNAPAGAFDGLDSLSFHLLAYPNAAAADLFRDIPRL